MGQIGGQIWGQGGEQTEEMDRGTGGDRWGGQMGGRRGEAGGGEDGEGGQGDR